MSTQSSNADTISLRDPIRRPGTQLVTRVRVTLERERELEAHAPIEPQRQPLERRPEGATLGFGGAEGSGLGRDLVAQVSTEEAQQGLTIAPLEATAAAPESSHQVERHRDARQHYQNGEPSREIQQVGYGAHGAIVFGTRRVRLEPRQSSGSWSGPEAPIEEGGIQPQQQSHDEGCVADHQEDLVQKKQ